MTKQSASPHAAGRRTAASVHLTLCVSFQMVRQVVEQGQCAMVNTSAHSAVQAVQPFDSSRAWNEARSVTSASVPAAR